MTKSDCLRKWASWYNEPDAEASGVEKVIFYLSMLFTLAFGLITGLFSTKFDFRFLLFLIPLAIWMFLRCSRKDMKATAYLIAGLFGAFGGAITAILITWFNNR